MYDGRKPSFTQVAQPELAEQLYEKFTEEIQKGSVQLKTFCHKQN